MSPPIFNPSQKSSRKQRRGRNEVPCRGSIPVPARWLACIPLAAVITIVWHTAVAAQGTPELSLEKVSGNLAELKGYLNTIWVLIAAILVIFMNAGFAMLETGLCRQKNAVNVLSKNLIVFAAI